MADVAAKDGSQVRCRIFRWLYMAKLITNICRCFSHTHVESGLIVSTFCFHTDRYNGIGIVGSHNGFNNG